MRKRVDFPVKQECVAFGTAASTAASAIADEQRFVIQDLSPSAPSYWTPGVSDQHLVTCVVGSTASSSSSFVDDESTSYEDITYNGYGPSSSSSTTAGPAPASAAGCDYGSLYHHHQHHHTLHQPYGDGAGYFDGGGGGDYHHMHQGYDDKPSPYDNNNAADACDMNPTAAAVTAAVVPYDDPYAVVAQLDRPQPAAPQVRQRSKNHRVDDFRFVVLFAFLRTHRCFHLD